MIYLIHSRPKVPHYIFIHVLVFTTLLLKVEKDACSMLQMLFLHLGLSIISTVRIYCKISLISSSTFIYISSNHQHQWHDSPLWIWFSSIMLHNFDLFCLLLVHFFLIFKILRVPKCWSVSRCLFQY